MSKLKIFQTKILLILVLFVCIILFICSFYYFRINNNNTDLIANVLNSSAQEKYNSSLPVRLKIPKIDIEADIEYVGLTSEGAMDVPQQPDNVAWFNLGPRPGEIGSAVIAGHSGWKDNRPAIFDNLFKLKIGDKIYITDDQGNTTTFIVRGSRKYDQKAEASTVFSSNDNQAHLNLVTCVGDWNTQDKTHSERLVIFADKE